jgi:hypothetical protein
MRLNVALNEELDIRIWSFPMRFQPTDLPNRSHVGEKWSRYQLRSMQLILQATHGVVSGAPSFFKRAFGDSYKDFEDILLRPHHFIFNRDWYERLDGKSEFEDFIGEFGRLSPSDKTELLNLLSSVEPRDIRRLPRETTNAKVQSILHFYKPLSKDEEAKIWALQKTVECPSVPDDERVEDAGLSDSADSESGVHAPPLETGIALA